MIRTEGRFQSAWLAGLLGVFTVPALAAEQEKPEEKQAETLDRVMVVGHVADNRKVPGSAQLITVEEIREQNYDDINQVLRRVPGVYLRQEDGFGLFSNISLRGVDTTRSAKVTVMEDGVLTAPAPYSAPAAYYTPTVGRMAGIEIMKGSSQVRFGPQTTGGVVNYLSTPIPEAQRVYLKSTFGRYGDLRTHGFYGNTVETAAGRVGVLLESYARRNGGYKVIDAVPGFNDRRDTGFYRIDPMVKLSWEPRGGFYQRFELKYGTSKLDANETYLGLSDADFAVDPLRRYAASRFDNIRTDQSRAYLRYLAAPSDRLDVAVTLYRNTFARNWYKLNDLRNVDPAGAAVGRIGLSNAIAGTPDGPGMRCLLGETACTLRVRANNRDYETQGVDVGASLQFESAGLSHELRTGLRYNRDQVVRFQWDDDYLQADNGAVMEMLPGIPGDAGDRKQATAAWAFYLQDSITRGRWTVVPGVRLERLEQRYINRYASDNPAPVRENRMNLWAASLGAAWDWSEQTALFGSVNRGFSPPSPKSAVGGIQEETSLSWELGLRHQRDGLTLESTAFLSDFNDLIVIDNLGGTGSGETENFGQVRSYGVEFMAAYDAGIARNWPVRNPWQLTATYTRATQQNDARSTDPESIFSFGQAGNAVPYIPEWVVNLSTGLIAERWGGYLNASYVSATYTSASNVSEPVNGNGQPDARFGKTDAYLLLDVSGFYQLRQGLRLVAGVQNLGDTRYIASRQPEGPRPGMPLFAYAGFELDL